MKKFLLAFAAVLIVMGSFAQKSMQKKGSSMHRRHHHKGMHHHGMHHKTVVVHKKMH